VLVDRDVRRQDLDDHSEMVKVSQMRLGVSGCGRKESRTSGFSDWGFQIDGRYNRSTS
jgi:hypothetical protein